MKKLLLIASLFIVTAGHAQTRVTKDAQGNYQVAAKRDTTAGKPTGQTITDRDGAKHPVFVSSRGKLYWLRTSKNGNMYKAYIKIDTD